MSKSDEVRTGLTRHSPVKGEKKAKARCYSGFP